MTDEASSRSLRTGSADRPLIEREIDGRYRVVEQIGGGGMGRIYRVEHVVLKRLFAMKVLKAELGGDSRMIERFQREARLAASISSEHVVSIVDSGILDDSRPYFVMELLQGSDLRRSINHYGTLAPARVANLGIDACRGLAALHAVNLIHRDLKPENLFLTRGDDGREICKILDFGVAKGADASSTRPGALVGTARYMAPEQVGLDAPVGPVTDVHALGVVLYECLSGAMPFDGDTMERILYQIMHGTSKPLAEQCPLLPPGFAEVVERAMARQPSDRYASARAFAEALLPFAGGRQASLGETWWVDVTSSQPGPGASAQPTAPPDSTHSEMMPARVASAPRRGWQATLAGVFAGAFLVGAAWWMSVASRSSRALEARPAHEAPHVVSAQRSEDDAGAVKAPHGPKASLTGEEPALPAVSAGELGAPPVASAEPARPNAARPPRPARTQGRLPPPPSFDRANPYEH